MRFKAILDTTAKMVTASVCVVIIIPFIFIFEAFAATHNYLMLLTPIIVILVIGITALWKPNAYMLDSEGLEIHRLLGIKRFSLDQLSSAEVAVKEELGLGLRTFGSGGAFGYLGKFWYSKAKSVTMYVTDRSKMILVTLSNGKKIMVSPDETAQFLAEFNRLKK